jgi:hypothetical protein
MDNALLMALVATFSSISSSLLTVTVTKLFDRSQKKQEHHYQRENLTQKDLFDKKIKIAEAAIAQFTKMKVILHTIREIIDIVVHALKGEIPLDKDILMGTVNALSPIIEEAKAYDTSSVTLYFNIKDDVGDQTLAHEILSSIFKTMDSVKSFAIKSKNGTVTKEEQVDFLVTFVKSLMLISKLLKTVEDDIAENIRIIKSDMQEFQGF